MSILDIPVQDFIESYHSWLREAISYKQLNDYIEISTPFLDRDNDHMNIYIYRDGAGKLVMSDAGYIMNNLEESGVSLKSPKRQEVLSTKLNGLGVELRDGNLEIDFDKASFPQAKNRLIQAMLSVDDMFYLSSSSVKSLFFEDVKVFFEENDIYAVADVDLRGRSGIMHHYDYVVQMSKHKPERIVKLYNTLNVQNAKTLLFSWQDTAIKRSSNTVLYTIYNDSQLTSEDALTALKNYGVESVPWSERAQLPDLLGVS